MGLGVESGVLGEGGGGERGESVSALGEGADAAGALEEWQSGSLEAVLARVKKAMGKQEWGVARRGWEEVLRRDGKHPGALVNLGWLAQREQRWGDAEG
ncbi:MAG: hypothetical protein RLZZ142_202 [Verrucomicrobiota bacterium]